jgi:hypothetical protein
MLPTGSIIRLGFFNSSFTDDQIAANATTQAGLQVLNANFTQIDFERAGVGSATVAGRAGYFEASENYVVSASAEGRQMMLWAIFSADNTTVETSLATALETGIFYMDRQVDSDWALPSDQPFPGQTAFDLEDLTGAGPTAELLAGARLVVGRYSSNAFGPFGTRNFLLEQVPEPTTAVLLSAAGLVLGARRRRST